MQVKNSLLFICALCLVGVVQAQVQEADYYVATTQSAKLYLSAAEVSATVPVNLKKGGQNLYLLNVPEEIDPYSIRVTTTDASISILSTSSVNNFTPPEGVFQDPQAVKELQKTRENLEQSLTDLHLQKEALQKGLKVIESNTAFLASSHTPTPEQLAAHTNWTITRTQEILRSLAKIQKQLRHDSLQLVQLNTQLTEAYATIKPPKGAILIHVFAPNALNTTLRITYVTQKAQWKPFYEIIASNVGEPLQFNLRALVSQNTGVHWNQVKLSFVYGYPSNFFSPPELYPWFLSIYTPPTYTHRTSRKYEANYALESAASAMSTRSEPQAFGAKDHTAVREEYSEGVMVQAEVATNQLNTTYNVAQPYSIRSSREDHYIPLGTTSVPATFIYSAIPRLDNQAYLEATVENPQKFNLVPAMALIFYERTLVGRTQINPYSQEGPFTFALGADPRIVTRHEKVSDSLGFNFVGTMKERTIEHKITLRNNQRSPIKIKIQESYPLSKDERIKIEMQETSRAQNDKEKGYLTWTLELAPAQEKVLITRYLVRYSKKERIQGL